MLLLLLGDRSSTYVDPLSVGGRLDLRGRDGEVATRKYGTVVRWELPKVELL